MLGPNPVHMLVAHTPCLLLKEMTVRLVRLKRYNWISQTRSTSFLGSSVLTGRKSRKLRKVTKVRCQIKAIIISFLNLSSGGFQKAQMSILLSLLVLDSEGQAWP